MAAEHGDHADRLPRPGHRGLLLPLGQHLQDLQLQHSRSDVADLFHALGGPPVGGTHRAAAGLLRQVAHFDVGNALGVPTKQFQVSHIGSIQ